MTNLSYATELRLAIQQSVSASLFQENTLPKTGSVKLEQRKMQILASKEIGAGWPKHGEERLPASQFCLPIAVRMCSVLSRTLGCKAWVTLGWLTDPDIPGEIYKTETAELIDTLFKGAFVIKDTHAWVTLASGEYVDAAIYPSLCEINQKRFALGRQAYLYGTPDGEHYRAISGLPKFSHHPQLILDSDWIHKLAQFDEEALSI